MATDPYSSHNAQVGAYHSYPRDRKYQTMLVGKMLIDQTISGTVDIERRNGKSQSKYHGYTTGAHTSEAAMGKIRMADKAGQAIPATWAVTAAGAPTTSPAEAIAGMLLPAGGAKGFGLSFMIDMLCGLLSQGASGAAVRPLYGDFSVPYDCSHLFIAIDVAHFGDPAWFRTHAAGAAERIRSGKRAPGVEQVFTPGEPEWRHRQRAADHVTLDPAVIAMLKRYAGELGVSAALLDDHSQRSAEG